MAFCGWLRQNAGISITLGPFLDKDDGDTEKTGLTIEDTDIYLSKNGAAKANPSDTNNCTEDADGIYRKSLNSTDVSTAGRLTVYCHFTDCLYVRQDYIILSPNAYDSLVADTDELQVDIKEISGDSTAADNSESFFDGTGYAGTNNVIPTVTTVGTCTTNTDMRGTDNAALASVCTNTRLAELDSGNIPTDLTNIASGVSTNGANIALIKGDTAATLVDTNEIQGKLPTNNIMGSSDKDNHDTDIDDILTDTGTTIPNQITALNNISSGDIETACGSALATYDPPTKAEMDNAFSALNDLSLSDIFTYIIENGITFEQCLRAYNAVHFNKTSGGGTGTIKYRNNADSKDRITGTVDANHNRTSIIEDLT